MTNNKSYISYSFWMALIVILLLLSAMTIPSVDVGEYKTRRVNILSDIIELESDLEEQKSVELVLDTTFMSEVADSLLLADVDSVEVVEQNWSVTGSDVKGHSVGNREMSKLDVAYTPIQDYDTMKAKNSISEFYAKLLDPTTQDLRIAFFGDSFIEGDLFTADVRAMLQSEFSGGGVGFVPITSVVSQFRGSVKHTFKGWKRYSLLKPKGIPEGLKDKFYVSGEIFEAEDGAFVRYESVEYRRHLKEVSVARFIFMNRDNTQITMEINDSISQTFTPQTSENIQNINITGDISSLKITVDNTEGFIGYGVVFEDGKGAVVDNYSLRGNSGLALCGSNPSIDRQIDEFQSYDMIVLQYGLNILVPEVSDYSGYARLMRRVVSHVKRSFPNSAIVIMGVSDRSVQVDGEFVTMPTLKNMLSAQHSVADSCGVAYWDTFQAMGGENSMVTFVEKKWGAKDYTHFSQAGGRYLAKKFVNSLLMEAKEFANEGIEVKREIINRTTTPTINTLHLELKRIEVLPKNVI